VADSFLYALHILTFRGRMWNPDRTLTWFKRVRGPYAAVKLSVHLVFSTQCATETVNVKGKITLVRAIF